MKLNTLTDASLLSIVVLPVHVGGDVALGFDKGGPGFFIWTLTALGVTGGLAMILSVRGLWNLRSRRT